MLLVYRATSGEVVDNSGTNSAFPDGVPDEFAYVNTDHAGIPRGELALLRLNDVTDAGLVAGVLSLGCTVVEGKVVLNDPVPAPAETPSGASEPEVAPKPTLESIEAQIGILVEQLQVLREEASDA